MHLSDNKGCSLALVTSFSVFVIISLLVLFGSGLIDSLDSFWSDLVTSLYDHSLASVFILLTHLGSAYLLYPLAISIFLLTKDLARPYMSRLILAMMASSLIVNLLKVLYCKDRPPVPLIDAMGYAYPSGHTSLAFVFYFGIFFLLYKMGHLRMLSAFALASSFVAVVAFSRTYLGVHYLSDVLGAVSLGLFLFSLFFYKYFNRNTIRP